MRKPTMAMMAMAPPPPPPPMFAMAMPTMALASSKAPQRMLLSNKSALMKEEVNFESKKMKKAAPRMRTMGKRL